MYNNACQTEATPTSVNNCSAYSATFACTACKTGYTLNNGTDCCDKLDHCVTHAAGSLTTALTC